MSPPKKSPSTTSGASPQESKSFDSGDELSHASGSSKKTVQACERCKKRKIRCDSALNGCGNCRENGEICEVMDRNTGRVYPRNYVGQLEQQNEFLKKQNTTLKNQIAVLQRQLQRIQVDGNSARSPGDSPHPGSTTSPGFVPGHEYFPPPGSYIGSPHGSDSHILPGSRRPSVVGLDGIPQTVPSVLPSQPYLPSQPRPFYSPPDGPQGPNTWYAGPGEGQPWSPDGHEDYVKWQQQMRFGGSGSGQGGGM